jgi:competence protein ComEC
MPARIRVRLRPLFVLLTATALGIVIASLLPHLVPIWLLLIAMAVLLAAAQAMVRQQPAANALCLLLAFALFGMVRTEQATRIGRDDISRLLGAPSLWVRGTVASAVESRPSGFGSGETYSFTLKVLEVNDYRRQQPSSGWLRTAIFSAAETPRPGDLLWIRGKLEPPQPATNPDGFDYQAYLKRQGIYATIAARREGDVQKVGHVPLPPLMRAAAQIRGGIERRVRSHLPPDGAALLLGMLLSERSRLPVDLVDAFTRTGTVHILSVSGMHVAVIAALLLWLLRLITVPKKTAHALCIAAVWLFALAASGGGGNPPAFRAALCATVFLAAPLLRRDAEPRHSLAFAALILLVLDPLTLFDPGAQHSFATVGTILLWNPLLERRLFHWEPGMALSARISRGIIAAVSVGLVAHLGSWPLAAFYFHQFSLVAPLANLPISVLADALVVGGLLFSTIPFLPWWLIAQGLSLFRETALIFAAPSWAAFSVRALPAPIVVVYYVLVGGLAAVVRPYILVPRKLFTRPAPAPVDTGGGGRAYSASSPVPATDMANKV